MVEDSRKAHVGVNPWMASLFVIVLLLPCYVLAQDPMVGENSSPGARSGWQTDGDTRSSWDILWTSLATIFACTWTILHLNTPGIDETGGVILGRRIKWFIVAVLAPEMLIAMAFAQLLEARRTVVAFGKLDAASPSTKSCSTSSSQPLSQKAFLVSSTLQDAERHSSNNNDNNNNEQNACNHPWTMAHGFLCTMGGLIVRTDGDNGCKYSVLREDDVVKLAYSGHAEFPELGERDIKDKSKADSFAKLFTLAQSTWLVINILGRAAYKFPVTPIEFMTLGYVGCSLFVYVMWWSKPKDVMVPLVIRLAAGKKIEDYVGVEEKRRKNMDDTKDNNLVSVVMAVLAVLYGAVHVAAWDFDFASAGERIAWRVCSVAATAAPVAAGVCPLLLLGEHHRRRWVRWLCSFFYFATYVGLIVAYVVARVALMVLACMAMRSLPSGCYLVVDWVDALPHI